MADHAVSGAPDSLPRRPASLLIAVAIVGLESLALLVAAVAFVVVGLGSGTTSVVALAVMFAVLAVGLFSVALSIWRMHRWGRPAGVAWQVLQALFGFSMLGEPGGEAASALGAIVPAAVFLVAIFMPATLRAFEQAAEYHLAHPPEPAPPPKRW